MNRTGRTLALGCLLLLQPLLAHAQAGGNSLLIPAMGRCTLNTQPQDVTQALAACQKASDEGMRKRNTSWVSSTTTARMRRATSIKP